MQCEQEMIEEAYKFYEENMVSEQLKRDEERLQRAEEKKEINRIKQNDAYRLKYLEDLHKITLRDLNKFVWTKRQKAVFNKILHHDGSLNAELRHLRMKYGK